MECAHGQTLVSLQPPKAKRYKPSRFNARSTTEDGTLLVYNSYSGHNSAFPPPASSTVESYLAKHGIKEPLDRLGEYLVRKGFLVEEGVDESACWDVRYGLRQFRTDLLQLILLASEDCNFRCIYCSQEFKRGAMLPRVREGTRNLVRSRIRLLKSLNISWFGGEPLLGYEAIEELAPFCQEIAKAYDVSYHSHITTNGYLLTPDRSRKMVEWGIVQYQITIDGSPIDHDNHRPLKDGGGTFQRILDNVAAMKEYAEPFRVDLRVNFDHQNQERLQTLFDIVKSRLGDDKRFSMRFRPVGQWGGPNDAQLDVCGVKEAEKQLVQLTNQARSTGLGAEDLSECLDPDDGVCYAARPYNFIVGADGKLMKCTVVLDTEPMNIVGNLSEDGSVHINEDALAKWVQPYYRTDSLCSKCFFVPVCQGAVCPLPRVQRGERPCPPAKLQIRQTLRNVWQEKINMGQAKAIRIKQGISQA